jgi:predicted PurR-regulated permease PerM
MKRLAWYSFVVFATLMVIFLLWQIRGGIWLFVFSLAVAATVRPLVSRLAQRGISLSMALVLVYSAVLFVIGAVCWLLAWPLLVDLQNLGNDLAIGYQHMLVVWPEGNAIQQAIAGRLPSSEDLYGAIVGDEGFVAVQTLLSFTSDFFEIGANLIIILVLSVYWAADRARFERLWLSVIPVEYRAQARDIWQDTEMHVGAYIRSALIQSLLAALLLWLGYWFVGLNYPIILAFISAVVWLIPIMGVLLSLLIVLAAGLGGSFAAAVMAAFYTLFVFLVLRWFIDPRFFDRQRFNGLLLVLVLIAFVDAFGLLGLIIAPAVAIAIHELYRNILQERAPAVEGKTVPQLDDLQERLAKLEAMAAQEEPEASPEVASMIQRLKQLIEEACQVAETDELAVSNGSSSSLPGKAAAQVQLMK